MIKNIEPLSMAEAAEYVNQSENSGADIKDFIKKFVKINPKKAKELRKNLEGLDLMKLKTEQIIKIIDLMPENSQELNKIFVDVGLDEDETKKILDTIKEFK